MVRTMYQICMQYSNYSSYSITCLYTPYPFISFPVFYSFSSLSFFFQYLLSFLSLSLILSVTLSKTRIHCELFLKYRQVWTYGFKYYKSSLKASGGFSPPLRSPLTFQTHWKYFFFYLFLFSLSFQPHGKYFYLQFLRFFLSFQTH